MRNLLLLAAVVVIIILYMRSKKQQVIVKTVSVPVVAMQATLQPLVNGGLAGQVYDYQF